MYLRTSASITGTKIRQTIYKSLSLRTYSVITGASHAIVCICVRIHILPADYVLFLSAQNKIDIHLES